MFFLCYTSGKTKLDDIVSLVLILYVLKVCEDVVLFIKDIAEFDIDSKVIQSVL